MRIACPKGYEPNPSIVKKAEVLCGSENLLKIYHDPYTAAVGANVLYTDVWNVYGRGK